MRRPDSSTISEGCFSDGHCLQEVTIAIFSGLYPPVPGIVLFSGHIMDLRLKQSLYFVFYYNKHFYHRVLTWRKRNIVCQAFMPNSNALSGSDQFATGCLSVPTAEFPSSRHDMISEIGFSGSWYKCSYLVWMYYTAHAQKDVIYLSIQLSTHLTNDLPTYLSICLPTFLPIYLKSHIWPH